MALIWTGRALLTVCLRRDLGLERWTIGSYYMVYFLRYLCNESHAIPVLVRFGLSMEPALVGQVGGWFSKVD
jgi:hypothetical protein